MKPYKNSTTLNLLLDVNDEAVKKKGAFAFTTGPSKFWQTYAGGPNKGKYVPKSLKLTSDTKETFSNENIGTEEEEVINSLGEVCINKTTYSDIFIITAIIHESLHALVDYEQKNLIKTTDTKSGGHTELNLHRDLFIKALTEYNENNKLNYTPQDIQDLSWHGTEKSTQFKSHFEEVAKVNGTTYDVEVAAWSSRVSELAHSTTVSVKK